MIVILTVYNCGLLLSVDCCSCGIIHCRISSGFLFCFVWFFPLHMRTVPLNGSSMCWRWRHQACRCSFICHFILIYCAGQEEPPWDVVSQPGMLWCGEKAGQGREDPRSWTLQVKRVVCVHWIIMASRRPWRDTHSSRKVLTIFEDLRRVLIT